MITVKLEVAMHCSKRLRSVGIALLLAFGSAHAAGKLTVTDAWIREAPPGTDMLAGYATLTNSGDQPIILLTVQSDAFHMASLHETIIDKGVSKMHELHRLVIAAGQTVMLQPGGKHLMLMDPRKDIVAGERIEMMFLLDDGTRVETYFDVVAADSGKPDPADGN